MFTIEGADKNVNGGNATYVQNKDGSVTWTNATEDTKKIGNDMLKTDIGKKKLNDMIKSDIKVKMKLNTTDVVKTKEGQTLLGKSTPELNKQGKLVGYEMTVYEKAIKANTEAPAGSCYIIDVGGKFGKKLAADVYSLDEHEGATATHEATHITDPKSRAFQNPNSTTTEKAPYQNQVEYYHELDQQKTQTPQEQ